MGNNTFPCRVPGFERNYEAWIYALAIIDVGLIFVMNPKPIFRMR